VIAFGVGFDVNATFLDRLAVQNSGMSEYVLPGENIEEKVPDFYSRMQTPVLIDTRITFEGGGVHDLYPREIGDLYGGHQILLAGRYAKAGPCNLVITGSRRGKKTKITVPIQLAKGARAGDQELIARIWAARKVGFLVDEIRLNGEDKELVASIVAIGTRFGILTEYTSFLAIEATDLRDAHANNDRAGEELRRRSLVESGSHGVAQAANTKGMQRGQVAQTANEWLGDDGRMVRQNGVQCVNGKALFNRKGVWQDPAIPTDAKLRKVKLYSTEFYSLLDSHPWLNRVIARSGQLNCAIAGEYISFVPAE
jgi:Ca-activated chloride channel family protein